LKNQFIVFVVVIFVVSIAVSLVSTIPSVASPLASSPPSSTDTGQAVVDTVRSRLPKGAGDMKITAHRVEDPLGSSFDLYVLSFEKNGKDYGSTVVPVAGGRYVVMGEVRDVEQGIDLSVVWQALTEKADIPTDRDHLVAGDPERCRIPVAVFSDYQCPYCRNFGPIVRAMADQDPEVCVYHYDFPLSFHKDAEQMAKYALAWRMLTGSPVPEGYWGATTGRDEAGKWIEAELKKKREDTERFWKLVSSSEVEKRVRKDMDLAERVKAGGTPTVFVSGHRLPGKKDMIESFISWKKKHPEVDSLAQK
jgi:protein-disulfide isomerase